MAELGLAVAELQRQLAEDAEAHETQAAQREAEEKENEKTLEVGGRELARLIRRWRSIWSIWSIDMVSSFDMTDRIGSVGPCPVV